MLLKFLLNINDYLLPCGFKKMFGFDCPGCGLQRSIIFLLQGNFWESIKMYPPLIPIILVFASYFLNNYFPFVKKSVFNKAGIVLFVIVAVNFASKFVLLFF